jgi:hypothetical protein
MKAKYSPMYRDQYNRPTEGCRIKGLKSHSVPTISSLEGSKFSVDGPLNYLSVYYYADWLCSNYTEQDQFYGEVAELYSGIPWLRISSFTVK